MPRRLRSQIITTVLILLVSLSAVAAVTWLAPSLSAATLNMLFRLRGEVRPPGDIVVVAVDDASLQAVGNWPWPRSVMASALDRITAGHPRAVGLDVIYAETSDPSDDKLLADAIQRDGRVVLPAQLIEAETADAGSRGANQWLMPLPEISDAAAATGHAHADPDVDGILRTVQLSKSDDQGNRLWAFGLETLRVAEGLPPDGIEEKKNSLRLGRYEITIHDEAEQSSLPGVTVIRPNEMFVNYLGPTRTFTYYSIADVLQGKVDASAFKDKIVLIGAVAQTMGDTRVTPFVAYGGDESRSGTGMPGVEVHANVIETIRRGSWLRPLPDWLGFAFALLIILVASAAVRLLDGWRVVLSLGALLALIVFGSLYAFNHYFVIPPVVQMLTGFFTSVPLLLIRNSIAASRDLDRKLETLARIQKRLMSGKPRQNSFDARLSFLLSILRADAVALFQKRSGKGRYQFTGYAGRKPGDGDTLPEISDEQAVGKDSAQTLRVPFSDDAEREGLLLIKRSPKGEPFTEGERRLAHEFAAGLSDELGEAQRSSGLRGRSLPVALPHNVIWKLRAVDDITSDLVAHVSFMNRVFTSMTDGLLVADLTGRIVFSNPAAEKFWDRSGANGLAGKSLTELFVERGIMELDSLSETMREVTSGRGVLTEVERLRNEGRFFTLQFSAVVAAGDERGLESVRPPNGPSSGEGENRKVIGLIVIITDVTKQRELERIRAETLQLVSHELRTPLTSIRGLSDALIKFPVPEGESKEMLETIYDEAVRMNELINRYLDLTRLESGTQALLRQPVAANDLLTGCAQSLGRLAADKGIRINLKLEEPSPKIFGDAQLLAQAVNNLLSNALKYSPEGSEVEVGSACNGAQVSIHVRDQGYGIPEEARERVFEKFYRLERDAKSSVVGTGLGLSLVKEIVERHGGQITLESELEKGSTFTIHLPMQRG